MIERFFREELARNIGSDVEINTDTFVIDGLLENVNGNVVTVMEAVEFGSKVYRHVSLDAIKFVRVL